MKYFFKLIAISLLLTTMAPANEAVALAAKMPANRLNELSDICDKIMSEDAAGVKSLCEQLKPSAGGGDKHVRYALASLARHVTQSSKGDQRAMFNRGLVSFLPSAKDVEIIAFILRQFERAGTDASVDAIAGYVHHEELCGAACRTLQSIGSEKALGALQQALSKAKGKPLPAIISSLGAARHTKSAGAILPFAKSNNKQLKEIAQYALAQMGEPSIGPILKAHLRKSKGYERSRILAAYLLLGKQLSQRNKKQDACVIFRDVISFSDAKKDAHLIATACTHLVSIIGSKAEKDLLAVAPQATPRTRRVLLNLSAKLDMGTRTKIQNILADKDPYLRIEIAAADAAKGDRAALEQYKAILLGKDVQLQAFAASQLPQLEPKTSLPMVIELLGVNAALATDRMKYYSEELLAPQITAAISKQKNIPQIIQVIRKRKLSRFAPQLVQFLQSSDRQVYQASADALGDIADREICRKMIDVALATDDKARRAACLQNAAKNCKLRKDPSAIIDRMDSEKARIAFIPYLATIGDDKSLGIAIQYAKGEDKKLQGIALKALVKWKSRTAIRPLLELAKDTKDLKVNAMSLQTVQRITNEERLSHKEKLANYQAIIEHAKRDTEKKAALSAITRVNSMDTVVALSKYLENDKLAAAAADGICRFVSDKKISKSKGFREHVEKAVDRVADAKLKKQAEKFLGRK